MHLLSLGVSVRACDHVGTTALHVASSSERAELMVPLLLERGGDVMARDQDGRTALHIFAWSGRLYGASCLLHVGADPNAQGK